MGKYLKKLRYLLITLLIFIGIGVATVYYATPWIERHQSDVEHYVSDKLGMPVTLGKMHLGWYYFEPVMRISNVRIQSTDDPTSFVTVDNMLFGMHLFYNIWHWPTGKFFVKMDNVQVNYPAFFNVPVPISQLKLKVQWVKDTDHWTVHVRHLAINNDNISVNIQGQLTWPMANFSDMSVALTSDFDLNDLVCIKRYLPDNVMKEKLRTWLHRSIVGGDRTIGTLLLKGHLKDFPFDDVTDDEGLFLVDSYWHHFALDYKADWPAGKNIDAHIIFKNRDLIAQIDEGTVDELPLKDVKATILGMGKDEEILNIHANFEADATKARHFILNSPLTEHLGFFNAMQLAGPADFDIGIQIPLKTGDDNNQVNGKVEFLDNTLILQKWWNLHFQHFKGWLTYNQSGIIDSQLTANLLTYPLTLNMKTVVMPLPATTVNITGIIGIDAIAQLFHVFVFDFMKGVTPYQANLVLTAATNDSDTLALHSNLDGVAIHLPKPYGKKATQIMPLSLLLQFSDTTDTHLAIDYAHLLNLNLGYNKQETAYHFKFGKIHFGSSSPNAQNLNQGLNIDGTLPALSISDWLPFLKAMLSNQSSHQKNANTTDILQSVQLNIPKIDVAGQVITQANMILSRGKQSTWAAHIHSDQVAGDIQVPQNMSQGITARLNYYYPNFIASKAADKADYQPKDIPPIHLTVNDFRYKTMRFGAMNLQTSQDIAHNTLTIKSLTLTSPTTAIKLDGSWHKQDIAHKAAAFQTQLKGNLVSQNIQSTLTELGMPPVIQGKNGRVSFNLSWAASLNHISMANVNGSADMQINNGVITHLNPSMESKVGLGKLINFFSWQTLFKRLRLDFSDVSSKGLNFDLLKGSFVMQSGKMTTQNAVLDSSIVDMRMAGTIDLAQQMYDLVIHASPHAGSVLPVLVSIAGGPIAILATLAANTLLDKSIKHASMSAYSVTGPWKDPKVVSVNS